MIGTDWTGFKLYRGLFFSWLKSTNIQQYNIKENDLLINFLCVWSFHIIKHFNVNIIWWSELIWGTRLNTNRVPWHCLTFLLIDRYVVYNIRSLFRWFIFSTKEINMLKYYTWRKLILFCIDIVMSLTLYVMYSYRWLVWLYSVVYSQSTALTMNVHVQTFYFWPLVLNVYTVISFETSYFLIF